MSFDDQRFSDLQNAIKRKLSEFRVHQEPRLFDGQSLGGKVSVKILLSNFVEYKVQEVRVDPALLESQAFMVEDLIKAAFDDAFRKSVEHNKGFISSLMSSYF
ncbi:YbaB/EbfC family nucleoid-associated protein [Anaplasma capra]|uniref:YbaB/EbfC family nucleoid-associated protein n=1 Tax=Anaplasma capra TaxID=1562740 RepID=UPI0021D60299|nr:YbaB/EbfC family nucleoid-associated protein [Anaplasma capra]MCU7611175.1 YbaB/EbfC family nucleoid-associated protein [Anaplasma capra]MCU7612321.1 YbaB/EbfC family nucleoid-associated protein [Anaplasma capra]